jgi:hypothetical protein
LWQETKDINLACRTFNLRKQVHGKRREK